MELTQETKIAIIKAKIESYSQQLYSLQLDYKVAKYLENSNQEKQIEESVKKVLKAIDLLKEEIDAISE
ncbi:MAG: hypothetical protein WC449_04835 [Candidatus Paceibacterota bacterium]